MIAKDPQLQDKDHDELFNHELISDLRLKTILFQTPTFAKNAYKHLRLHYDKFKNSTHFLILFVKVLHKLREYEDSLEILKNLLIMLPNNALVKQYVKKNEEVLFVLNNDIKEEEKRLSMLRKEQIHYKYDGVKPPDDILIYFQSEQLSQLKQEIKTSKHLKNFSIILEKMKREWSIYLGDIEGVYTLSKNTTRDLINLGILEDIILHDNKDPILSLSTNGDREARAVEIRSILHDQMVTLNHLYSIIKERKLELSNDLLFKIHSLLLRTASFSATPDGEIILVRTNKFKNIPNTVIRDDGLYHLWALPSVVQSELNILYEKFDNLLKMNVAPEVLATWFHMNFIKIHPFQDGNGRVARTICSLIFIYHGLLPLVVPTYEKNIYLEHIQKGLFGNTEPLLNYFVEKQLELWNRFINQ